jgi:hypothetical protein|nr:MAG TPA: hypothetical protein [Bacteriophage sp.]DAV23347.1 MAG TPA: hypothetical protein [Bacteriophage sp.]DAZ72104.1 MAG TPA: hypothetical protein [Caudoviricetes sp.]
MKNRNEIEIVTNDKLTKRELIDAINKTFPDDEIGDQGIIAYISTTEMTDGTKMQTICFGKILEL